MVRLLAWAMLVALVPPPAGFRQPSTLHITVTLAGADGVPAPVVRHALLISDDPPTAVPRRVLTSAAGTADLTLAPGTYVVESERPVRRLDTSYRWTQVVVVTPGTPATLALDAANAEVSASDADASAVLDTSALGEADSADRAAWRTRAVTVWTPTRRAAGVVLDPAAGLVLAPGPLGDDAGIVEVQLSPAVKVAGRVLDAPAGTGAAIVRFNPAALPAPILSPPVCPAEGERPAAPPIVDIDASSGDDVDVASGDLAGLCAALASLPDSLAADAPPSASLLPVEPLHRLDPDALAEAARHRAGSLNPYEMTASDFEIRFITPVMMYADQHRPAGMPRRAEMDFGEWSAYVNDLRPVVYVRVMPKRAESLWTTIARGAALTQGVALPAFTRVKAGFSRLRLVCGREDVTPIHPFVIEQPVSDTRVVQEGFYVFDPAAFDESCAPLKLVLFSQADPEKGDERAVSRAVIRQITREFAPSDVDR